MSNTCRVCQNKNNNTLFTIREMLYGTKEEFTYFECDTCNSLQIQNIPVNMSVYYPSGYLGDWQEHVDDTPIGPLRSFLRQQRVHYLLYGKSIIGRFASMLGEDYFNYDWNWFRSAGISTNSRILDVGCGPGVLLKSLQRQGFSNLHGLDPFQDWTFPGLGIKKCQLNELSGTYDFIMLHHSFEHMPNPLQALESLKRLCSPSGKILIRIPVANCYAWKNYGVNWYQIDAPRHLVIPSVSGMQILAKQAGLTLFKVEFDSNEMQFCCSEQYAQNIPLKDERSYHKDRNTHSFSHREINDFKLKSEELNKLAEGDQACFYFENSL